MPQISLVIPTFNESKNIPILIERIATALNSYDKEVIVVDDNSPDKTWEVARNLSQKYSWLRVIRRVNEKGLSSAVLAGFAVAEGDLLAVMDADLQHDESILPKFIQAYEGGSHLIVGSRKVEGGGTQNWSPIRKFISWVATQMAHAVLRQPVSDPMSGFFAISRTLYNESYQKINPKGFKILLEFVVRAKHYPIKEIGYKFRNRIHGESKLSSKVIIEYLKALYELSFGQYIPVTFLKYALVGVSGLFVSYFVLLICLNFTHYSHAHSVAASIEISLLTNFFLNNAWTFKENKLTNFLDLMRGLLTFHAICLSGAIINQAIALKFSSNSNNTQLYLANAAGYLIAAIWNYTINVGITWKHNRS